MASGSDTAGFQIFRASDAPSLAEAGCMTVEPFSAAQREGMDKLVAAGFSDGEEVRVLVDIPGFSLTHVWFKAGFPLPLHSHDADCLYYIVAGSIRLGTEDLGPRDSFFVPADVPYTYRPGPDGVEILKSGRRACSISSTAPRVPPSGTGPPPTQLPCGKAGRLPLVPL